MRAEARLNYEKSEGWITIGGVAESGKQHARGTPVKIDSSGRIAAGPKALTGKHLSQVDQGKRHKPAIEHPDRDLKLKASPERKTTKQQQKPLFDVLSEALHAVATPAPGPAQLTVDKIHADPKRFQYKISGVDSATGVTKSLDDAAKYNPLFGGQLLVWHDPDDKKTYVINGHHRLHLAKRSGFSGPMSVYYLDAKSPEHARAIGALANIAGGNGTATDAAKFLRDTGTTLDDMKSHGVSVSGAIARDAIPLSRMHPDLFQKLTNGLIDERRALAISRHVSRPESQKQLHDIVSRREDKTGKRMPNSTIEEMAREMEIAGTRKERGSDLFGDFEDEKSNFVERGEIRSHIRKQLSEDKNAFRAVAKSKRNKRLSEAGNVLNTEQNAQQAEVAARAMQAFDQLANLKGPLSDLLNSAANDYGQNPKKRKSILDRAYREALGHIQRELGAPAAEPQGENRDTYSRRGNAAERRYSYVARLFDREIVRYMRFDESQHPRGEDGKFSSGGVKPTKPKKPKPPRKMDITEADTELRKQGKFIVKGLPYDMQTKQAQYLVRDEATGVDSQHSSQQIMDMVSDIIARMQPSSLAS